MQYQIAEYMQNMHKWNNEIYKTEYAFLKYAYMPKYA